jgi:hypothetical protein
MMNKTTIPKLNMLQWEGLQLLNIDLEQGQQDRAPLLNRNSAPNKIT